MPLATIINLFAGPGLIILLVVVLFFFGGKKLPGLAHGLKNFGANFRLGKKDETAPKPPANNPTTKT